MSAELSSFDPELMNANAVMLAENTYPGRGIVLGNSADGNRSVEAFWVMGRSENSRNRKLVQQREIVRTEAIDPSTMQDPTLVIYNAMREYTIFRPNIDLYGTRLFIVSNGDQTDTVWERVSNSDYREGGWEHSFRNALLKRDFEPDDPNFTPRITGMIAVRGFRAPTSFNQYQYSIIRRNPATGRPEHSFGAGVLEEDMPHGAGICFHTYKGEGNPLPGFQGSPYAMPLEATASETAESLWENLNDDNRIALAVKTIDKQTGEVAVTIINKQIAA